MMSLTNFSKNSKCKRKIILITRNLLKLFLLADFYIALIKKNQIFSQILEFLLDKIKSGI